MRIGAMSRRSGVSQRLLRYYEEQGLLKPSRRPSGFREYRDEDVRTVQNIRTLLAAGLSTHTIADLMPCMLDDGQVPVPACPDMLPDLYRERQRLTEHAAELLAARDVLDTVIAATPPPDVADPVACLAVDAAESSNSAQSRAGSVVQHTPPDRLPSGHP